MHVCAMHALAALAGTHRRMFLTQAGPFDLFACLPILHD